MAGKKAKPRLGRGLDGLLPPAPSPSAANTSPGVATARIEELHPNKEQPRRYFDERALEELSRSISEHGVLEPILVRDRGREGGYEIIAGERRWRAAQRAGLKELPIFVRELGDEAAFEAALVENLQREDLNPLETARAFQRLSEEFGHTQEQIAQRVGKDRSTIANALRLLKLPPQVLEILAAGELSEGHGRALLTAPNTPAMVRLAREAIQKRWSVRELERRARALARGDVPTEKKGKSSNVRDLERRLSHRLGQPVAIQEQSGQRGKIVITYASYDELDGLISRLK
ncbi:MAG: ParB/RepB/Spo0J family partition protein [Myxococcota bacterium]